MSRDELRNLKVGDRVRLSQPGGASTGTVVEKHHGVAFIVWDDGGGRWSLNWRAKWDRERARNIEKLPADPPTVTPHSEPYT
jgi:hypothetical protein